MEEYYPGDDYVDVISIDIYYALFADDTSFAVNALRMTSEFASKHDKLYGITETGFSYNGTAQGAQDVIDSGIYDKMFNVIVKSDIPIAWVQLYGGYRTPWQQSTKFEEFIDNECVIDIDEVDLYSFN